MELKEVLNGLLKIMKNVENKYGRIANVCVMFIRDLVYLLAAL